MSKNQPRDGNGKFAKTIKVVDKYGNSAYFTPEELEGFGKKKEEKNPDCEPATKGYVKCQIRKLISVSGHSHECINDLDGVLGLFSFFAFIGSLILGLLLYFVPPGADSISTFAQCKSVACNIFTFCATMGVICGSCLIAECKNETEQNIITDENKTPLEFQKYKPPMCEKKDDCS